MGPHLIATIKVEGTLFSLLIQIQKHLMFLLNILHKLRCFFMKFSNCSQMFQISYFVAKMDISSPKLEVCLPLAYPRTIYNHFSILMPLDFLYSYRMRIVGPCSAVWVKTNTEMSWESCLLSRSWICRYLPCRWFGLESKDFLEVCSFIKRMEKLDPGHPSANNFFFIDTKPNLN